MDGTPPPPSCLGGWKRPAGEDLEPTLPLPHGPGPPGVPLVTLLQPGDFQQPQDVGRQAGAPGLPGLENIPGTCLNSLQSCTGILPTQTHTVTHSHPDALHMLTLTYTPAAKTWSSPRTRGIPGGQVGGDPGGSHFPAMDCSPERAGWAKVTPPMGISRGLGADTAASAQDSRQTSPAGLQLPTPR